MSKTSNMLFVKRIINIVKDVKVYSLQLYRFFKYRNNYEGYTKVNYFRCITVDLIVSLTKLYSFLVVNILGYIILFCGGFVILSKTKLKTSLWPLIVLLILIIISLGWSNKMEDLYELSSHKYIENDPRFKSRWITTFYKVFCTVIISFLQLILLEQILWLSLFAVLKLAEFV